MPLSFPAERLALPTLFDESELRVDMTGGRILCDNPKAYAMQAHLLEPVPADESHRVGSVATVPVALFANVDIEFRATCLRLTLIHCVPLQFLHAIVAVVAEPETRPPSLLALPSYLASQVATHGSRHLEAALDEHRLLRGHHAVLVALDDFGPLSQQQLAASLKVDKSHLVGRVDDLETRGLITRAPDPSDRRRHHIALTAPGRALLSQLRLAATQSEQRFLYALSAEERHTFTALLRRVLTANDTAYQAQWRGRSQ